MHLKLQHTTRYTYETPVRGVVQMLRLTPRPYDGLHVVRWRIDVDHDATLKPSEDSFGNVVHSFCAEGPLDALTVTVEGEVLTEDTSGILHGTLERLPLGLYLRQTPLTTADRTIADFARDAADGRDQLDALHALMAALSDRMTFDVDVTHVHTTADEAFADAKGVCQDFAHIFIAAARSLKFPARYVSGYMRQADGREHYEAGHGWAEVHVPGVGWIGFDPTNAICATDAYIRVAIGLDYLDASPVRGVRTGGAHETLDVSIQVQHGASQQ